MSGRAREGERVGALIGSDGKTKVVRFLGYGTMLADRIPGNEAVGMFADMAREAQITAPAIQLDGDDAPIVYGPEVWFSGEDDMKRRVARWEEEGWTIQRVDIRDVRCEWVTEAEAAWLSSFEKFVEKTQLSEPQRRLAREIALSFRKLRCPVNTDVIDEALVLEVCPTCPGAHGRQFLRIELRPEPVVLLMATPWKAFDLSEAKEHARLGLRPDGWSSQLVKIPGEAYAWLGFSIGPKLIGELKEKDAGNE